MLNLPYICKNVKENHLIFLVLLAKVKFPFKISTVKLKIVEKRHFSVEDSRSLICRQDMISATIVTNTLWLLNTFPVLIVQFWS